MRKLRTIWSNTGYRIDGRRVKLEFEGGKVRAFVDQTPDKPIHLTSWGIVGEFMDVTDAEIATREVIAALD